jgi:hypothetical protein
MQREFLKDQSKTKKAEMAWFDKLEDELDRMETDEKLLEYKIANSKKQIQKEINRKDASSHSVAIQQVALNVAETDDELDKKRPLMKDVLDQIEPDTKINDALDDEIVQDSNQNEDLLIADLPSEKADKDEEY